MRCLFCKKANIEKIYYSASSNWKKHLISDHLDQYYHAQLVGSQFYFKLVPHILLWIILLDFLLLKQNH